MNGSGGCTTGNYQILFLQMWSRLKSKHYTKKLTLLTSGTADSDPPGKRKFNQDLWRTQAEQLST